MNTENTLELIRNEQLSSVEFVQDYLQLRFDGNTLTCYMWPSVVIGNKSYNINDNGYRDLLCEMIAHEVSEILFKENEILMIYFDNGNGIRLNLIRNETNQDIPEFAYFQSSGEDWLVLD